MVAVAREGFFAGFNEILLIGGGLALGRCGGRADPGAAPGHALGGGSGGGRGVIKLYLQKWRWYERNSLPWNRLAIHREFMKRGAFVRWPVQGNVLEALREGRLEVGEGTLFEPNVWITCPGDARIRIGQGTFVNMNVMVAAHELVEIGDHCMFANGCFVTDANHRFDDPEKPITWQGFTSKGPTRVGDNVWCGAHVVITSGVTIGERCVIGANSVVTEDIPPFSIAAGAPAKVLKRVDYDKT